MNEFEQIERVQKLAARAGVTIEEARGALELCNWDMLDAFVYLEKAGLVKGAANQGQTGQAQGAYAYSTAYEQQSAYTNVEDTVKRQEKQAQREARRGLIDKFRAIFHKAFDYIRRNSFVLEREGKSPVSIPLWVILIVILVDWELAVIASIILLIIGFRFSVTGGEEVKGVNNVMDKAGEMADKVKEKFDNM